MTARVNNLDDLAIIADASTNGAGRLLAKMDPAKVGQVLSEARAMLADPARLSAVSRKGRDRLAKFADRLERYWRSRGSPIATQQASALAGMGGRYAALKMLYGIRNPHTPYVRPARNPYQLGGLGSWLSSAFRSITGTRLSDVAGPLIGAAASAIPGVGPILGPIAGAVIGAGSSAQFPTVTHTPGDGGYSPATSQAYTPSSTTTGFDPNAPYVESQTRVRENPVRPAEVPADWVPHFWASTGTGNNTRWTWRWQAPRRQVQSAPVSTYAPQPTYSAPAWSARAALEQERAAQYAAGSGSGIKTEYLVMGGAALLTVLLLARR